MKTNLFINFYQDKNAERQKELVTCVLANIYNKALDTINIIVANKDLIALLTLKNYVDDAFVNKINIIPFELRPTYNHYFKFTEKYPDDINIISNKDIVMDEQSLLKLKQWDWKNYCLALSRWDFVNANMDINQAIHYNHADSQDTWMVKGAFKQCNEVNFGLGVAGCDNKIALLLEQHYIVINPSLSVKTYHYHLTNARNYTNIVGQAIERIQPPYKLVTPTVLPQ